MALSGCISQDIMNAPWEHPKRSVEQTAQDRYRCIRLADKRASQQLSHEINSSNAVTDPGSTANESLDTQFRYLDARARKAEEFENCMTALGYRLKQSED
ncbi:hypothetical protein [Aestuariispira insulae]|nr:hypothetical protein [Aestuariispira insulae]